MSKIRYYTDEHVSKAIIRGLRQRGIDVLSVPGANMLGASDEEHLALAMAEGRVIFTHDDDFLRFAAAGTPHAGMVYASRQISVGETIRGLMLIHQILEAEEMTNMIEYL